MAKKAASQASTSKAKKPAPKAAPKAREAGPRQSGPAPVFQSMPAGASFFELSRLTVVRIDSAEGQLIQKAQTSLTDNNLKQIVVVRDLTPPV